MKRRIMPTDHTTENHMSKDELIDILNDIDGERQQNSTETVDRRNESPTYQNYPDPSNQFL